MSRALTIQPPKRDLTQSRNGKRKSKTATYITSAVVAISLSSSIALMSHNAKAFSFSDITQLLGATGSIIQSDYLVSAFKANTAQTAMHAERTGKSLLDAAQLKAFYTSNAQAALKVRDVVDDHTIGKGVTNSANCTQQAERVQVQNKAIMATNNSNTQMTGLVGDYVKSDASRLASRSRAHFIGFCDITEAAQGSCIPLPHGLGGADSNYSLYTSNPLLSDDTEIAAQNFVTTIIDPSRSSFDTCTTLSCQALVDTESRYGAIASVIQNSLLAQINDRRVLMPEGSGSSSSSSASSAASSTSTASSTTTAPKTTATTNAPSSTAVPASTGKTTNGSH